MRYFKLSIKNDLKKFFKNVCLILIPFIVILPLFLILVFSKEVYFRGVNSLVRCQTKNELCMVGLAYTNPGMQLKFKMTEKLKPEVLALGTSRVMAFRKYFFETNSFYNAGGGISRISHYREFLRKLPSNYKPKIMIISLDQCFFNEKCDDLNNVQVFRDNLDNKYEASYVGFEAYKSFYNDIFKRKINLDQLKLLAMPTDDFTRVGISAHLKDSGFLNDGSYHYGDIVASPNNTSLADFNFLETFKKIENGIDHYEYSADINYKAVDELKKLLEECQKYNIYVVGFLPPFAQEVLSKMRSMDEKYSYLSKIYPALITTFKSFNYPLLDATDLTTLGASPKEVLDGYHGSEKAYLRLFIKLIEIDLKQGQKLQAVSKPVNYLNDMVMKASSDINVFPL